MEETLYSGTGKKKMKPFSTLSTQYESGKPLDVEFKPIEVKAEEIPVLRPVDLRPALVDPAGIDALQKRAKLLRSGGRMYTLEYRNLKDQILQLMKEQRTTR